MLNLLFGITPPPPTPSCSGPVRIRIENLPGVNVPVGEMPRLERADEEGYVMADPVSTGAFMFDENWLQAGVGTKEGDYRSVITNV